MDFNIPEEIEMLRQSLRKFIEKEVIPMEEKARFDPDDGVPQELLKKVRKRSHELGFWAIDLPEEYGGGGLNMLGTVVLREEVSKYFSSLTQAIFGGPEGPSKILLAGTPDQIQKYLVPVIKAEQTCCFALTEPNAGSDAASIETSAVQDGDHWVINGLKHFITNGPYADYAIVFAVTDREKRARGGITCFLVDRGTPGFSVGMHQKTMGGGDNQSELVFEDCRVPRENVLGQVGMGFVTAMTFLGGGRLSIAAGAVGMTEKLLKASTEYAKQRVQFGKPIATKQAVQWMLADIATELFAARNMVYNTAWRIDQGEMAVKEMAMCKLYATELVNRAADVAVQIHGGMGYMKELPIERVYRGVRALRIVEGTSEIQRYIIARTLMAE
ncbi:MAG: acyl-CoA dehydrogenase [Candidatus Abyssobacteria bacterium SURF_5]|uniref:Acyl-CoA dehydrogenase n=1 Tax=Abyssobacteria bacterium (strain SURF_5) TaxID=2093360 RepID=A0A3A4ND73_ABYX5|nr:MAG: acyl-CoA dehydrogenase [Candidatus Abyssubacteria bacterium SURF_5]